MPPETPDEAHNEDVTQNTILTMTEGAAEVDRQIRDAMEIAEEEMKSAVFQNPSSAFQPQIEILKQSNWACQEGVSLSTADTCHQANIVAIIYCVSAQHLGHDLPSNGGSGSR